MLAVDTNGRMDSVALSLATELAQALPMIGEIDIVRVR
ncbi:hypothetical protein ACVIRM_005397 [Rhizobium laguerreae]